jgi:SAM-dependent methyltransferase
MTPSAVLSDPAIATSANFDRIAHPYRWMEYLTFGPMLWRCRTHLLAQLTQRSNTLRNALILGDGDGRFTAVLLATLPQLHVDAVDSSSAMLRLLSHRAHTATSDASTRLRIHHADALTFAQALPADTSYDLVVTHFFLDCLTQSDVESLVQTLAPHLNPGDLWFLSDFRIPTGPMRFPARALVRSLFLAFRALTGLPVTRLPDHAAALTSAAFARTSQHLSLAGILTSELWARVSSDSPA